MTDLALSSDIETLFSILYSPLLFLRSKQETVDIMSSADELKALGNKAIAEKKFDEAM